MASTVALLGTGLMGAPIGLYASLVGRGLGHVDHSGTYLELERLNGSDPPFATDQSIT